jgi:hypothetical protein
MRGRINSDLPRFFILRQIVALVAQFSGQGIGSADQRIHNTHLS